ncbi:MAG: hypothetical protein ABIS67_01175 [Candidatus Eisenbacteria bacterium]
MRWNRLALPLLLMAWTAPDAVADLVGLRSGATMRGTVTNRSEILASPRSVITVVLLPEMPGTDPASVRSLSFARSEVDFVVLESGRTRTTVNLSAIADPGPAPFASIAGEGGIRVRRDAFLPKAGFIERLWLSITVSGSDYAMADLNDLVAGLSSQPGAVVSMEPIGPGLGAGMELGLDLPSGFEVGLAWDRMRATSGTDSASETSLSVSAFLLRVFGSYGIARSDRGSVRLGVSLGAVVPSVIIGYTNPTLADHRDRVVGVAPAGEVCTGGEFQLYRWLGFSLDAGYRRAISREVPIAALDLRDLDYSGGFLRAGLRFSPPN